MTPSIDAAERLKAIAARIKSGKDSYAGRLDAWHALGNVSGEFQTWKEMLGAAQAAFPVLKLQLEFQGAPVDAWGTFRADSAIPKGLEDRPVRKLTLPEGIELYLNFLATVGKDYQVIQHTDGFELLDHLVGQIDGAHYETMGTLDFGRLIWGQVDPNISIRVGNDVSNVFLTFHTSHDGSKAFDIFETGIRVVCRNTFRISSLKRLGATLRVRHTRNANKRIETMKAEIDEMKSVALTMEEKLNYLAARKVERDSMTTILDRLFPKTKKDDEGMLVDSTRRTNILKDIVELYESNDKNAFPEIRGTSYNLLNSIVEWTDHLRSSKGDGRAESAVFGSGDRLKSQAMEYIMEAAPNMPVMRMAGATVGGLLGQIINNGTN